MNAPGRRRVLVVDDDEAMADALATLIRTAFDDEVYTAYDGAAAIDLACSYRPDIVFMDLAMPFVSGMEAAEILERLFGRRRPRLISISGLPFERATILAAGFSDHFAKPVEIDRLLRLLGEPR